MDVCAGGELSVCVFWVGWLCVCCVYGDRWVDGWQCVLWVGWVWKGRWVDVCVLWVGWVYVYVYGGRCVGEWVCLLWGFGCVWVRWVCVLGVS